MLFSSPDYPLFLIAVFFLYGLARWGGKPHAWARYAVMVLLADVVFLLVAKDPDVVWDPIGGTLLRLVAGHHDFPPWLIGQLAIGTALMVAAISIGRRYALWIASEAGQKRIGIGLVLLIAVIGGAAIYAHGQPTPPPAVEIHADWPEWFVAWIKPRSPLDELTGHFVQHGHLLVLAILGVGLGASRDPRTPVGRVVVLFVVSALFYHAWASAMPGLYRYLLFLLLGTIVLDYYLGLWIERARSHAAKKALVIVSLCSNLGILFFFKYYDFFVFDVVGGVAPGLTEDLTPLKLILPAGISFHTFQSLSYTIDVYRGELKATKSATEFATFVLFFPQLVAGPIVRAQDLLPQLADPPRLDLAAATDGLFRICVGLFKKIALADTLALSIVDRVFEAPTTFSAVEVLCGVYAYALQIYLDFSAYSDIAIGSAQVLGFTLPENFRTPYRSANLQEFWRRWHISLSTWLRDYLYITLGGSRGAEWRTYFNLSMTMLLGGLWHGASYAFIVWGALHGFGLAVTRYFQRATGRDGGTRVYGVCVALAVGGITALYAGAGPAIGAAVTRMFALVGYSVHMQDIWWQMLIGWLTVTPLWAVLTASLGDAVKPVPFVDRGSSLATLVRAVPAPVFDAGMVAELLRVAMCINAVVFLAALKYFENWTWIPLVLTTWGFGIVADFVERGAVDWGAEVVTIVRRTGAVILTFHYVCLAWIFFRASSFDSALAILRQLGEGETDHANLIPMVTCALVAGFTCHFFADGSFRWLRRRFVALPTPARGALLVGIALVLRQLAHHDIVPFIYFQF